MKRDKDPDRREVMKKFTFKSVLDNFRTSAVQQTRPDQEIQETLRPENFQVKRVSKSVQNKSFAILRMLNNNKKLLRAKIKF